MIYEPAEDSYILQKYVKLYARGNVLDMGAGSGIQAETAKSMGLDVTAADINPEAVQLLNKKGIKAKVSDLFSNIDEKFDTIIFNPPYLPEEEMEDEESRMITTGGKKGYELIGKFLKQAVPHLKKKGIILIVVSTLTGDVENLFTKYGYRFKILGKKNLFFESLKVYMIWLR